MEKDEKDIRDAKEERAEYVLRGVVPVEVPPLRASVLNVLRGRFEQVQ